MSALLALDFSLLTFVSMDDMEFLCRQSLRSQIAFESNQRIAERVGKLCFRSIVGVDYGGAATIPGATNRFADDAEDRDGVVTVDVDFRDG